ncbi:hypothetical protein Leryth_005416 [Lithospermum erythrorhizon]|nr:hypothetical protein Leryth_005416 [Lithospermum erythrorhizon]
MNLAEPDILCMKHPNHKQQPGVCSCCLIEKLSKLSLGPFIIISSSNNHHQFSSPLNISSPANYQYYSSGSTSSYNQHQGHLPRTASGGLKSSFVSSGGGGGGLKKSRSMAVITMNGKKKKEGFWSKLIKSTTGRRTNKEGSIIHPRMKDRFVF